MYCTNCGTEFAESANFCGRCGKATRPDAANGEYFRAAQPGAAARRLERPMDRKWLAGVCQGFADYFNIDSTLVRILWLGAVVFFGTGLVAYVICWIVMPLGAARASVGSSVRV
ncbi:MAG: hypothetical protein OHK0021_01640 [Bryobacter sp.]